MLAVALTLALAVPPAAPAPAAPPDEHTVSELLVIASRTAPDPSAVTTECVWRELPAGEREALTQEVGRTVATLGTAQPYGPKASVVTEAGVGSALRACGAPAEEEALPFARTAVRFYALERIVADSLAAKGLAHAKLEDAWNRLSEVSRATLTGQAGRLAGGADEEPEAAALIIFSLIRRLRPLNAFNPWAYKGGGTNHLIVAHYAPRAVRHAMEKRF